MSTAIVLFRVAQEALANIRKHAETKWFKIELRRLDTEVYLAVRDFGRGFDPAALEVDPELAARLLRRLASEGEMHRGAGSPHEAAAYAVEPLTSRELEVLGLMKLGRTNRQIAGDLVISLGTAKNHVEHIISKLGVSDRTRAVVQALELGLIDPR